jgi:bile acid-coenzyme A ligase
MRDAPSAPQHDASLEATSGPDAPRPRPVSYGRRVAQLAAAHPDRTAIVFAPTDGPDVEVSFQELDRRANQVAQLLAERGARQGSMVVVGLRNSPEHLICALAAWRTGSCVLPLRFDLPRWERDRLLGLANPAVVVADWDDAPAPLVRPDELDRARELPADPLPDRVPDPARAIATSGTTGRPKLIVTPGPGLYDPAAAAHLPSSQMPAGAEPVELVPAPLYHTNGFAAAQTALLKGTRLVLMERFDAEQAVGLVERHRVTSVIMAPTMLLRIARLPDIDRRDLSSLQSVLQGAAPCPAWLVRRFIELVGPEHFFIAYGSSEAVGITLIRGDEWLTHPGSVGRGSPTGTEVRILDEHGRELPPGEVGEIYLRQTRTAGPSYEYRGAPPAPTTADGFTSVGDLGWLDEDGYLYIADRRVDLIVTGGANVYPAEVEAALIEHPGVADVAVVGLPDEEWGRRVHAIVVPADPAAPPTAEELRAHCAARLARYKLPKSFELVASLPRSEAGKLNRQALIAERAEGGLGAAR